MQNANDLYVHYNGTSAYFKHAIPPYLFTEGVQAMCEECNCYWLVDLILSHQYSPAIRKEYFQVWRLIRLQQSTRFIALMDDGNKLVRCRQFIPYSDFSCDEATIWLVDNVLLLPCEY